MLLICIKSWQDSLSDSVKRDAVSALRSNLDQRRISEARVRPLSFECRVLVWLIIPAFDDCERSTLLLRVAHMADVSYRSPIGALPLPLTIIHLLCARSLVCSVIHTNDPHTLPPSTSGVGTESSSVTFVMIFLLKRMHHFSIGVPRRRHPRSA